MTTFDTFTQAYITCALWSSVISAESEDDVHHDKDGEPFDRHFDYTDIAPESIEKIKHDCDDFQKAHWEDIQGNLSGAGHDFWLTRNGHGAGFWDGDWPKDVGERLTKASKECGEVWLYLGDDGKVYFQ